MKKRAFFAVALAVGLAAPVFADSGDPEPGAISLYSFFINVVSEPFRFPLIGFVNLHRGNYRGAQIGFVNWNTRGLSGLQAGFVNTAGGRLNGAQVGFVNTAAGSAAAQVGFVNTAAGNAQAQIGFVNTAAGNAQAQIGFVNTAVGKTAAQIGFVNTATGALSGAQIGFVNIVDSVESGAPIGFISIVRKGGYRAAGYSFSEFFAFGAELKLGTEKFYTTIAAHYDASGLEWENLFVGLGIGTIVPLGGSFFFNPEAIALNPVNSRDGAWRHLYSVVPLVGYAINGLMSVTAGPAVTWSRSGRPGGAQEPIFGIKHVIDDRNSITVGARAGLRFRL